MRYKGICVIVPGTEDASPARLHTYMYARAHTAAYSYPVLK